MLLAEYAPPPSPKKRTQYPFLTSLVQIAHPYRLISLKTRHDVEFKHCPRGIIQLIVFTSKIWFKVFCKLF